MRSRRHRSQPRRVRAIGGSGEGKGAGQLGVVGACARGGLSHLSLGLDSRMMCTVLEYAGGYVLVVGFECNEKLGRGLAVFACF